MKKEYIIKGCYQCPLHYSGLQTDMCSHPEFGKHGKFIILNKMFDLYIDCPIKKEKFILEYKIENEHN